MDFLYRKYRSEGVGAEKHSAEPFTIDDENKLHMVTRYNSGYRF